MKVSGGVYTSAVVDRLLLLCCWRVVGRRAASTGVGNVGAVSCWWVVRGGHIQGCWQWWGGFVCVTCVRQEGNIQGCCQWWDGVVCVICVRQAHPGVVPLVGRVRGCYLCSPGGDLSGVLPWVG